LCPEATGLPRMAVHTVELEVLQRPDESQISQCASRSPLAQWPE
jgi:hypothetical protein